MTTTEITMLVGLATIAIQSIASNAKQKRDTSTKIASIKNASEQWVRDHFAHLAKDLSARLDRAEAHARECEKDLTALRELLSDITPLDPAE